MLHVSELAVGDELHCWMKLGLAIRLGRNADGSAYRYVPDRTGTAEASDLTRFAGLVTGNNTENQTLTMWVSVLNHKGQAHTKDAWVVTVSYTALKRVRRLSKYSHQAKAQSVQRPTKQALGTAFNHYRVLEEVSLR